MKKHIKTILLALLFCFALAPAVKSQAAVVTPAAPTGLELYAQDKGEVGLNWKLDSNLPYYSDAYPGYYGYEVTVTTLKNKAITVVDSSSYSDFYANVPSQDECAVIINNAKFKTQGFKFKVRSYVYDENQAKVYSPYSAEKVIVPRAVIKKAALTSKTSKKVKITWNKVSGAKNYTVYFSSNEGKSYKKLGTTSKTNYTITKSMAYYKNYVVYVQANGVKYKGKKYNSTKPTNKLSNSYRFQITQKYSYY